MNSRGQQAVNISAAFTALAFVVVSLRLYTRFFLVRCPGIEDYGIILAMICSIGLTICIGYQATYGMGQHIGDLLPEQMESSLKAFWASLIVYYLSLGLTKGSILLQYRRVFTTKKFQISCWIVMAVVICYTIWTVFSSIFACVPIRAFWTKEQARCINQFAMWFTNAAINILTDFAIIILPMPVIRRLSLGQRQKTALIGIFGVGGADASLGSLVSSFEHLYNMGINKFRVASLVCIVSILRLQSLVAISNSADPTYDNPPAATWSSVETNVGIICSCLPLLRPLLIRWIPGATSLKRSTTAPRAYATIGSTRNNKDFSDPEFMMSTKMSHLSHEDQRNIEVITDIHIQVEGGERRLSDWCAPPAVPPKNWESTMDSQSGRKREGSQDSLVKDVAPMV